MSEEIKVLHEQWPIPTEFPIAIASDEVNKDGTVYNVHVGKAGLKWFVPANVDNPADNIYVTETADWKAAGNGFGGRPITFNLVDGKQETIRGPWHSNSEAFYQDTNIDIRDKHKTFVVIAKRRDAENLYDVLYYDEKPQISDFKRGERLAMEYAKKLNEAVVSFSRAHGGAVIGMVYP